MFCDAPDGDKPAECRRTDHASNGQSVVTITAHCAGLHSLHVRYNDVNVLGKVVTCNSVINSSSSRMGHRQEQLHMLLSPTGSVKSGKAVPIPTGAIPTGTIPTSIIPTSTIPTVPIPTCHYH